VLENGVWEFAQGKWEIQLPPLLVAVVLAALEDEAILV
jgi:hypothetical protein